MKKTFYLLLFVIAVLGSTQTADAQLKDQRRNFAIGINGGVNFSSVSFEPNIKQSKQIGPSIGITARYISEKYFSMICGIQAELNYSQRGWNEKIEDGTEDTYDRKMNYLELPLLAHLAFGKDKGNGGRFFLNLGPQIGFLISEKENKGGTWIPEYRPHGINKQYDKPAENKFDYGIVGGGGVEIRTGIGNFLVEARYYFGLSDFYKNTKKDFFSRSSHSYISAKIAYLFDLKK